MATEPDFGMLLVVSVLVSGFGFSLHQYNYLCIRVNMDTCGQSTTTEAKTVVGSAQLLGDVCDWRFHKIFWQQVHGKQ